MAERVVLPSDAVPTHYSLELSPDLEKLDFTCDEEITFDVKTANLLEITLHSKEIYVESASFKPTDASVAAIAVDEISYNKKLSTVKFIFASALPTGTSAGAMCIKYRGILNGDMAGFYRSNYTDADGEKKVMASTQFEALDARRAFPCVDEPAVKATFKVALIVPAHLTALSNMPETSSMFLPKKLKRVVFDTSPKMSTYLLAWAVGEFDFVQGTSKGGVMLRVFSPPGRALQGTFALDMGIRSLDFYDEFFQVPYPLPKMDMICITEFAMGAMENWGLVTYRENALMIDEKTASSQTKQRVAIVVAHELAHQWFGNLVTMSWWDGLWLNEGFAAYMEHFCTDACYPDYKMWEQFTTGSYSAAQRLDALKSSHPIIVPIKHAEEVEQVFDAISYCKGSTVVNMVAAILGKDKFKEGLQVYMKKHAYGNTETPDLWNAWSEVSGKDVAQLMSVWTKEMGYPYVKVVSEKWGNSAVEITLEQTRFLSDGSATENSPIWSIPLLFASAGSVSAEAVMMTQPTQTFSIPISATSPWIKINAGQKALVRVAHSKEMISRLQTAVKTKELSAVDRAALLLDSYALAKANLGEGSLETVVTVLKTMEEEDTSIGWDAISGVLNGLYNLMEQVDGTDAVPNPDSAFAKFVAFGKKMVVKALGKVGWDAAENEPHTEKLMRATVLSLLSSFAWDDDSVKTEAKRRFDAHWEDPSALPTEYKGTVYAIVLMNGGVVEYERLLQSFHDTEDNQVRKYVLNTLGSTNDPKLKVRTLDWAVKSGEVKLQDYFYPIGSVSSSAAGAAIAWQYYQTNFETFKEMLAKASPSLMDAGIVYSVNRFCSTERADEIEKFFETHPLPSSARRISQTVEGIRTNSAMLERIKTSALASPSFWA